MVLCVECKYRCLRDDGTSFCNLGLPPWFSRLFPKGEMESVSQDTELWQTCSFGVREIEK